MKVSLSKKIAKSGSERYAKERDGVGLKLYRNLYRLNTTTPKKRQSAYFNPDMLKSIINGASKEEEELKPKTCGERMLIKMDTKWKMLFDTIVKLLVAYSCFSSIYLYTGNYIKFRVAFRDSKTIEVRAACVVVEVIFLADTVFSTSCYKST